MALHLVIGASTTLHAEMVARVERVSEDQRRPNFRRGLKEGAAHRWARLKRRIWYGEKSVGRWSGAGRSIWSSRAGSRGAVGEAGERRGKRGRGEKPIVGGKEGKNWVGMGWWASKANELKRTGVLKGGRWSRGGLFQHAVCVLRLGCNDMNLEAGRRSVPHRGENLFFSYVS